MKHTKASRVRPELRELAVEASRALGCLDVERLEELALFCNALDRCIATSSTNERAARAREAREAAHEMAAFARVLEATCSNRNVMNHLRELRMGRLEYRPQQGQKWMLTENGHGDN